MDETEFDHFADHCRSLHAANIAVTGEEPEYFPNRVPAPNGLAFVFERNPYNPLTRHAVNTCPLR